MDNLEPLTIPYYMSCLANGYRYECTCGELHCEEGSAWDCRECRLCLTDLVFDSRRVVESVVSGLVNNQASMISFIQFRGIDENVVPISPSTTSGNSFINS